VSWFSDFFGRAQEEEIADSAFDGYAAVQQQQYREAMAENAWTTVCRLCGGAGGIECPAGCGGHAGGLTDCTRCGGGGAIPCPVCVCSICSNDETVKCLLCPPDGSSCDFCNDDGFIPCPGCAQ
jgi:hypothetical protein